MVRVSSYHCLAFALGAVYVAPSVDPSSFSALLSPWSMKETSTCVLRLAEASAVRTVQRENVAEAEKGVVGANQGYDYDDDDDDVVPLKPKTPTIRSVSSTGHRRKKKMKQWLIWTSLGLSVAAVVGALAFAFRPGEVRQQLEIASASKDLVEDKAPPPEKDRFLLLRCAAVLVGLVAFPIQQARYKLQKLFFVSHSST
ncbi:hypothetical protein CSUI_004318 [Cystoisospora suis]|uniref:Transmembrane protein n=1 Tax=Cystoisospora suis TaxID=483139 RepID=A0A2C6L1Z4_9APIC|nr:hypothetical protein CSUI_004318 [Cystoisospora suis]